MVNSLKWTSVTNTEVELANFRLEASVFNVEAKKAKADIDNCSADLKPLCGTNGIAKVYHLGRFKRIYVEYSEFPIFQPSQIIEVYPKPYLFLSEYTDTDIQALRVNKDQILMTCSGTIGKCSLVTERLDQAIFSHDLLRITANDVLDTGYIYAYLKTKTGQLVLLTNNYGAVIQHIEPGHLDSFNIPYAEKSIRLSIHKKIFQSYELRDQSNVLMDEAEKLLFETLNLPLIENLKEEYFQTNAGFKNYSIRLNFLDDRLEGSYHAPIINSLIDTLLDSGAQVMHLGHSSLTTNIYIPNRFKRIYLEEEDNGTPFFSGRCIHELDPSNKKYISSSLHKDRIGKQLLIKENMILITCSGTTGKVNIVPPHWNDWVMTHDIIRVIPIPEVAGYLHVWLNSEYGRMLLQRYNYGMVVPHIETENASKVPIPILKDKSLMKKINDLALQANKLRSEAYYLEQAAITQMEEEVIFA